MSELNINTNPGFFTRSNAVKSKLRDSEKKIIEFIEQNQEEIIHLSITEVAERSETSESSVVRLCKRLGYKGFQDLKINLAKEVIAPEKQILEVIEKGDDLVTIKKKIFQSNIQALYDTIEVCNDDEIRKAVEAISKARLIEFYGTGGSGTVALDAHHKLLKLGIKSFAYNDPVLQAMSASVLTNEDVVIGISHTGSNTDVLAALKLAKEAGATLICITNSSKSPITNISDIVLQSASKESLFRTDAFSSRIAQLTIIDLLVAAVANQQYELCYSNIQKTRRSTIDKKL
ncbi:MurR/RpiR family transcriptional regulator [Neobacillus sp. 179-C4.2 HS]|jgi:RpiR family transcriptional regulator, carbohydrate utilization regulator|uniref:MurR/RpiR family transcriptional regulator n=1 Tax=Neobacillus driksii TaxID=3035913 RepID=A0ABV4YZU7_9BACI|nr:MurR/RpiR family transcriptional regulator [Neobacillus sp. 179.-C4.2 HS]MDP5194689.1 MurR/RpiR family transcriptional regulator [Neobacillus sp. 179.-C4.2 HS]